MALCWVLKDEEEFNRQTKRHTHTKTKKRSGRGDRIVNGTTGKPAEFEME